MSFKIEPAYVVYNELIQKIMFASLEEKNKWFFSDGAFTPENIITPTLNNWINEEFAFLDNNEIVAFISARWVRPLDVIHSVRLIVFNEKKFRILVKGVFWFFDYLFTKRGCNAVNWVVALKNIHAYTIYEKFITNYFGHRIGIKHYGQKSYSGEISDIILYEVTKEEYLLWKKNEI